MERHFQRSDTARQLMDNDPQVPSEQMQEERGGEDTQPEYSSQSMDELLSQKGTQNDPAVTPLQLKCANPTSLKKKKNTLLLPPKRGK